MLREVRRRNSAVSSPEHTAKLVSDYAKSIGCADSPNKSLFVSRAPVPQHENKKRNIEPVRVRTCSLLYPSAISQLPSYD